MCISRRRIWWTAVILTTVACASPLKSAPTVAAEPTYGGHPLSYWVLVERRKYDPTSSHIDVDLDAPAKNAVQHVGSNGIPFLLEWISLENGYRAAWAFGALGHTAEPTIPELARMATNLDYAIDALGRIGPAAIPALSALATNRTLRRTPTPPFVAGKGTRYIGLGAMYLNPPHHVRPALPAVQALAGMGTNAMAAVPAFIECLRDEDPVVVTSALSALRNLKPRQESVLVAERAVLGNKNSILRGSALYALGTFGEKALPDILPSLQDEDDVVRSAALGIVIEIAPQTLTNAAVLAGAATDLCSSDRLRQRSAAQVLRAAGQWVHGNTVDLSFPVPGGWDRVLVDATNALLRLAPGLLPKAP